MPQYKIKLKNLESGLTEYVTVVAETKRVANLSAVRKGRRLLGTDNIILG